MFYTLSCLQPEKKAADASFFALEINTIWMVSSDGVVIIPNISVSLNITTKLC